jgi:hypothetical protein
MMKFIKDMLTGIDNDTWDIARVTFLVGFFVFVGLEIYQVVFNGQTFEMINFGTAFGAMIATLGVTLKLKQDTEPKK